MSDQLKLEKVQPPAPKLVRESDGRRVLIAQLPSGEISLDCDDGKVVRLNLDELRWLAFSAAPVYLQHKLP